MNIERIPGEERYAPLRAFEIRRPECLSMGEIFRHHTNPQPIDESHLRSCHRCRLINHEWSKVAAGLCTLENHGADEFLYGIYYLLRCAASFGLEVAQGIALREEEPEEIDYGSIWPPQEDSLSRFPFNGAGPWDEFGENPRSYLKRLGHDYILHALDGIEAGMPIEEMTTRDFGFIFRPHTADCTPIAKLILETVVSRSETQQPKSDHYAKCFRCSILGDAFAKLGEGIVGNDDAKVLRAVARIHAWAQFQCEVIPETFERHHVPLALEIPDFQQIIERRINL